jgi:nucleotide-binding universal stress UspA family protein
MTSAPYRSVLVPLDGSTFAEHALPMAAEIARRSEAMLQLALVHHPVPALATAIEVPEFETQIDQESRDRERAYLSETVGRVRQGANVPVTSALLDGPVADALEVLIDQSQADLVVMTTHGRGPMSRFWLGSVADHVMRHVRVPVLLVRPDGAEGAARLRRILVALDGSTFAEQAVDRALALGNPAETEFTLVMVVEPPYPIADPNGMMVVPVDPELEKVVRERSRRYLDGKADQLRKKGYRVVTRLIDGPPVGQGILEAADLADADLIALASHGRGGLPRVVLGSVADKIVRGTTRAVLVVRPVMAM